MATQLKPTELRSIADLEPHPENYNLHPVTQISELAQSVDTFDQFKNIVVWTASETVELAEGERVEAAKRIGITEVEVKDYSHLSYAEALLLMQIDNAAPMGSKADRPRLAALMDKTKQLEIDRPRLADMLRRLRSFHGVALRGGIGEDEAPSEEAQALAEKWGVELGQIWQLGDHRLAVGDSADEELVSRLFGSDLAHACLTDPPYGTASENKVQKVGRRWDDMRVFNIEWDEEAPLDWLPLASSRLEPGAALISFWENAGISFLWEAVKEYDFSPLHIVYWKKPNSPQPRPNFCSVIESSVFARKSGRVLCWNGGGSTPNCIEAPRAIGAERTPHPTQKPLGVFAPLMETITDPGMTVYDPFVGSGTTIIAAERLRRRALALDLSPEYCAIAIERFFQETGVEPALL